LACALPGGQEMHGKVQAGTRAPISRMKIAEVG